MSQRSHSMWRAQSRCWTPESQRDRPRCKRRSIPAREQKPQEPHREKRASKRASRASQPFVLISSVAEIQILKVTFNTNPQFSLNSCPFSVHHRPAARNVTAKSVPHRGDRSRSYGARRHARGWSDDAPGGPNVSCAPHQGAPGGPKVSARPL